MIRKTEKYKAAIHTLLEMTEGRTQIRTAEDAYGELAARGWRWDSDMGEWRKFEAGPDAISTGLVDIRLRAHLGDVERAKQIVEKALDLVGVKMLRASAPDPDDRDGPAVTARIYMQVMLPKG